MKFENRFADFSRIKVAAKYQILKDRGVSPEKITERLNISSVEVMDEWLATGFVEQIKEKKKDDFAALYRGFDEYSTKSLMKIIA